MLGIILLIVGFGFVIFVHELGHFLAAKWVGIRVDQFALGFGQALLSYRKGMGLRVGSSGKAYAAIEKAAGEEGSKVDLASYGETEYRFNWMPLGGYVKMLGQDDLNPNAQSADPRSYNSKSIGARMLVVSAGVIMNIIFGTLGFMLLFSLGLSNPPAIVGSVQPFSPAQAALTLSGEPAPLQVGDQILEINGRPQYDFTKVRLAIALSKGDAPLTLRVKRLDGRVEDLQTTPRLDPNGGFLYIGFTPPALLRAPEIRHDKDLAAYNAMPAEQRPLQPGELIIQANGIPLQETDFVRFHEILQKSDGRPVALKVQNTSGAVREVLFQPQLVGSAGEEFRVLGMEPRTVISGLRNVSPAAGKIQPGDIILSVQFGDVLRMSPTIEEFRKVVFAAGEAGKPLDLSVLRGEQTVEVKQIIPNVRVQGGYGLGVDISVDQAHAVVAGAVAPAGKMVLGSVIKRVAGQEVNSWYDVMRVLRQQKDGQVRIEATDGIDTNAPLEAYDIPMTEAELKALHQFQYTAAIALQPMQAKRQTSSPIEAAKWGVEETRDFAQQFYVGLQRMFEGTVSPKNMMGPLGMVHAGSFFADKGLDSVLWFLAMISANLALVNFLPIPIVDGGLFLFLVIEKIQGKPLSARAQNVAQYIGLAILLSVFVFATYQDILRFLTMR